MKTALNAVLFVISAAATQSGYVAPVASGFIYRNDHNGPASLIQLGAVPFQLQHTPLPLAQPLKLKAIEAFDLEPAPLPYVAAKPIAENDDEDDDEEDSDESEEYVEGGLKDHSEEHHSAHGEKGSKDYKISDSHAKGLSGHYGKEHNQGFYNEAEGEVKSHNDEADAHGNHHESRKGYKGGDHGHKKHFSKGEDITGYHKVFHKDEFKKDHDFYDVADNSGHFKKHKFEKAKHGSKKGGHKEGGRKNGSFHKGEFGKGGFHAKGRTDESVHDHSAEEGNERHYNHEEDYGKKGERAHKKEYAYDEEDED